MNTNMSYYSPPSSGGESEDVVSSDSHNTIMSAPPLDILSRGGGPRLTQKRKAGRKKFKETRHPIFHGVRERDGGKWVCEVREPNKQSRIWLGTYPTADLAARAYDVAVLALRGDKAVINFPDSAWLAPRAKSTSPRDIRLAALQATTSSFPCEGNEKSEEKEECSTSTSTSTSTTYNNNNNDEEQLEKGSVEVDPKELFLDEEVIFNMPSFIDSMAAGMLLTPPSLKRGIQWDDMDYEDHNNSCYVDLDLW